LTFQFIVGVTVSSLKYFMFVPHVFKLCIPMIMYYLLVLKYIHTNHYLIVHQCIQCFGI